MFEVEMERVFSPQFQPLTAERRPSDYQPYLGKTGMRWESGIMASGFSEAILLDDHSCIAIENWHTRTDLVAPHVFQCVHHLGRYVFIQMRLAGESTERYQSGVTIRRQPMECSISTVQTRATLQKTERMTNGHLTLTLMFRPEALQSWLANNVTGVERSVTDPLFTHTEEMAHARFGMSIDMVHMVRSIIASPLHGALRHQFMKQSAISLLCLTLSKLGTADNPSPAEVKCRMEDRRIADRAAVILNGHLAEAPSIASLSRELGTNKNKLLRSFKNSYGKTIQQYVLDLRMNTAYSMIVGEGSAVSEIAQSVGYDYVNNFSTRFTEYFGISPAQLRQDERRLRSVS